MNLHSSTEFYKTLPRRYPNAHIEAHKRIFVISSFKERTIIFGRCLNLNAQTSVLFIINQKPNAKTFISHLFLTPLIFNQFLLINIKSLFLFINIKSWKCRRRKTLQADSAGTVRLKLTVRIGDFSDLQSQEIITVLAILFGSSRSHLSKKI